MTNENENSLAGMRVLILEDEPLVSMLLEGMIMDFGCQVLGPFLRIDPAVDYIRANHTEIDIAILDVNVGGERSFAVADLLHELGVPFVFASGYDEAGIDERWRMWPNIGKLFYEEELKNTLASVIQRSSRAIAS